MAHPRPCLNPGLAVMISLMMMINEQQHLLILLLHRRHHHHYRRHHHHHHCRRRRRRHHHCRRRRHHHRRGVIIVIVIIVVVNNSSSTSNDKRPTRPGFKWLFTVDRAVVLETNESDAKSLSRRLENRTFLMDGPSRDARTWPDGWTVWTDERMNGGRGGDCTG